MDKKDLKMDYKELGDNSIVRYTDKDGKLVEFQIQTHVMTYPKPLIVTEIIKAGQVVKKIEKDCADLINKPVELRNLLKKEHDIIYQSIQQKAIKHSTPSTSKTQEEEKGTETEPKEEEAKEEGWLSRLFKKWKK